MLENIEVLCHSSIKISKGKVIYIDPFKIDKNYNDADIIFITHDHYDHYSEEDIDKVRKSDTVIVAPEELLTKLLRKGFRQNYIITIEPDEEDIVEGIKFETIPAYNTNKQFHPKENGWVGYIIELAGNRYYIAGDTDITEENKKVKCDVAFVPVRRHIFYEVIASNYRRYNFNETIKWKRGIAMKFSNYIMSQSSKDIDKFSRKFSNILN